MQTATARTAWGRLGYVLNRAGIWTGIAAAFTAWIASPVGIAQNCYLAAEPS